MDDPIDVLGRRVGAGLIDVLLLSAPLVVADLLTGDGADGGFSALDLGLTGFGAVVFFALCLVYYGACEVTTGQTLGKRLLGIRVIDARSGDHGRPRPRQVATRTLLRLVDGLAFYFVAFACIISTGERRGRIGDLVGGTAVVRA